MKSQSQIIANLIDRVGGQKKLIEITKIPQSRFSEWLHEKNKISLVRILEICEKCNINLKDLL